MKARIIGDGPLAILLAGLLAADKQQVVLSADPGTIRRLKGRAIRLILPQGWLECRDLGLSSSCSVEPGELGLVALPRGRLKALAGQPGKRNRAFGSAPGTLLLFDADPENLVRLCPPQATVLTGLSLFSALQLDVGEVEVASAPAWFIIQKHEALGELRAALKEGGFDVLQSPDISGYANSLFLLRLLDLPLAMCHSTLYHFLSYAEGRDIAAGVLEEGLRTCQRLGMELARLPADDPQELLQKLCRKPWEFDGCRFRPDRRYSRLLHSFLAAERPDLKESNEKLVRLASAAGVDPRWNWRLAGKLGRVLQVGFYADPADLYQALR